MNLQKNMYLFPFLKIHSSRRSVSFSRPEKREPPSSFREDLGTKPAFLCHLQHTPPEGRLVSGPAAARDRGSPSPESIPFPAERASSARLAAGLWGRAGAAAELPLPAGFSLPSRFLPGIGSPNEHVGSLLRLMLCKYGCALSCNVVV